MAILGFVVTLVVSLVLLLLLAYATRTKRASAQEEPEYVPETAPSEIQIDIKLSGSGFATPEELDLRNAIQDEIEESGIGEVVDCGSGMGEMNVAVEVADMQDSLPKIKEIIQKFGLLERARFTTYDGEE